MQILSRLRSLETDDLRVLRRSRSVETFQTSHSSQLKPHLAEFQPYPVLSPPSHRLVYLSPYASRLNLHQLLGLNETQCCEGDVESHKKIPNSNRTHSMSLSSSSSINRLQVTTLSTCAFGTIALISPFRLTEVGATGKDAPHPCFPLIKPRILPFTYIELFAGIGTATAHV